MDISLFFDAVDQSYSNLFEGFRNWEETACALLLSYENVCRLDPDPAHVDIRKYGVMHALRWGRNAPSQSISLTDSNAELGVEMFRAADALRRRGSEYLGVFACRQLLKKGVLSVQHLTESSVATIGDLNWFAFEQLDDILDWEDADNAVMDAEWIVRLREELEVARTMTTCTTLEEFYLSQSQLFCGRMAQAGALLSTSYRVPSNWECLGVSMESVRQVGVSLFLVATMHSCLTSNLKLDDCDMGRLLIWRKTDLVQFLANSSNLPTSTVRQIIDQLVYQREISPPDIALGKSRK